MTRAWRPYLDLARGLAAILVATSHARAFIFEDYAAIASPTIFQKVFYFFTGLGHESVIVFFVLSGFLIGGTTLREMIEDRWSWSEYLMARLTRLWIVLLPAVAMTAFWDGLGMHLSSSAFYDGRLLYLYHSGPLEGGPTYSLFSAIGNCLFLQTVAVPVFGSNGPLWSLANEFWYYILFPVFLAVFRAPNNLVRLAGILLVIFLLTFLTTNILIYGLIWLFGVAAYVAIERLVYSKWIKAFLGSAAVVYFILSVVISRVGYLSQIPADFLLGSSVSLLLVIIAPASCTASMASKLCRAMARWSYTLYLFHFPILAFVASYLLENRRIAPSIASASLYVTICLVVSLYVYGMFLLFESRTEEVRQTLRRLLFGAHEPSGA